MLVISNGEGPLFKSLTVILGSREDIAHHVDWWQLKPTCSYWLVVPYGSFTHKAAV